MIENKRQKSQYFASKFHKKYIKKNWAKTVKRFRSSCRIRFFNHLIYHRVTVTFFHQWMAREGCIISHLKYQRYTVALQSFSLQLKLVTINLDFLTYCFYYYSWQGHIALGSLQSVPKTVNKLPNYSRENQGNVS